MRAWALAERSVSLKDILPTTAWMLPPASLRNSILPAVYSLTAVATSVVTVPALGEAFALGVRDSPYRRRAILGIMSGVAMATSTSVQPPLTLATSSSTPRLQLLGTGSLFLGGVNVAALDEGDDAVGLADALGEETVHARTILVEPAWDRCRGG